jgi:hypothetical protein
MHDYQDASKGVQFTRHFRSNTISNLNLYFSGPPASIVPPSILNKLETSREWPSSSPTSPAFPPRLLTDHSLEQLAANLITTGPVKAEPTPRRVRALFNGTYLFDTTSALHVWEHKYFPQFWVPISAFDTSILTKLAPYDPDGVAFRASIKVKDKTSDRVIISENGLLKGFVRVEFKAAGK